MTLWLNAYAMDQDQMNRILSQMMTLADAATIAARASSSATEKMDGRGNDGGFSEASKILRPPESFDVDDPMKYVAWKESFTNWLTYGNYKTSLASFQTLPARRSKRWPRSCMPSRHHTSKALHPRLSGQLLVSGMDSSFGNSFGTCTSRAQDQGPWQLGKLSCATHPSSRARACWRICFSCIFFWINTDWLQDIPCLKIWWWPRSFDVWHPTRGSIWS